MIDGMTGVIKARFGKWRKQRFAGHERFPSFTSGTIMVRDTGWRLGRDDKGLVLSVKLHAGLTERVQFALRADGGSAHAQARLLASGAASIKQGDCKLVWDDSDKKWSVRLAYTRPLEDAKALDPSRVLSVHRGVRCFLTWADSDGGTGILKAGAGQDIANFKKQMTRRRAGMRSHMAGSPRHRGHGWWRKFDNYRALDDTEARFTDTKCKQAAAEVRKLVLAGGYGTVLLDDWNVRQMAAVVAKFEGPYAAWLVRRFPFAQLKGAIECALEPHGVGIVASPAAYESIECPSCHNIDASQDDGRGTFTCKACAFKRGVDGVANLNALARAGIDWVLAKQDEPRKAWLESAGRERSDGKGTNSGPRKGGARKPVRK